MCGIVGVAGNFSQQECLEIVGRMNGAIIHRGPDDEGIWSEDGFGFGMRRLSIIDLALGHQPMWDEATGTGVVFNGEVYNYRALRKILESKGERNWKTQSDTEVVLKSLVDSGEAAIHGWNGMFGVAAWNSRDKSLLLIRDRMGVKPLYYFWDGKTLLFASEIKAIMASGLVERRVNKQSVWDYLTYRYVPGPESIWEGIRKLPPGHLLRFREGGVPDEICYWKSDVESDATHERSEGETDLEFASLFMDAVNLRLVASDVPVGVFLSGGLDSSAIAAAAVELGHKNFHTFSVGFEQGGYYSELPYARQVADHVGSQHHEVIVNEKQFLDMLPDVIYATDEPLADLTLVPLLALARLARKDVKVVLSGEGSDEILGGYDLDKMESEWNRVRALQRIPPVVLKMGEFFSTLIPSAGFRKKAAKVANLPLKSWNEMALPSMTNQFTEREKQLCWPVDRMLESNRILVAQYQAISSGDPLQQLLSVYQKSWLVEDLLMKADKTTMAASLEARTPFLDYRLVEWANRQANSVKIKRHRGGRYETKSVLRRFCAPRLPKSILDRPKRGFPVPAYGWLQNGLNGWAREMLLDPGSKLAVILQKNCVDVLIKSTEQNNVSAANQVWTLIVLELWLRQWNVNIE